MTGTIITYGKNIVPAGHLLCDGSVVSQTDYAGLYAVIGTSFNTGGEGAGNFRLPNLVGKTPFGKDGTTKFLDLGTSGGSKTVSLTHTHTSNNHTHAYASGSPTGGASVTDVDKSGSGSAIGDHTHTISAITSGTQSVNTMTDYTNGSQSIVQKYVTVYFLIKI